MKCTSPGFEMRFLLIICRSISCDSFMQTYKAFLYPTLIDMSAHEAGEREWEKTRETHSLFVKRTRFNLNHSVSVQVIKQIDCSMSSLLISILNEPITICFCYDLNVFLSQIWDLTRARTWCGTWNIVDTNTVSHCSAYKIFIQMQIDLDRTILIEAQRNHVRTKAKNRQTERERASSECECEV